MINGSQTAANANFHHTEKEPRETIKIAFLQFTKKNETSESDAKTHTQWIIEMLLLLTSQARIPQRKYLSLYLGSL
jgi:hypothetical protein